MLKIEPVNFKTMYIIYQNKLLHIIKLPVIYNPYYRVTVTPSSKTPAQCLHLSSCATEDGNLKESIMSESNEVHLAALYFPHTVSDSCPSVVTNSLCKAGPCTLCRPFLHKVVMSGLAYQDKNHYPIKFTHKPIKYRTPSFSSHSQIKKY